MKSHACQYPTCGKRFTRAEHLRRHALNHEQPRNGFTCERCSVHFQRPDLLGEIGWIRSVDVKTNHWAARHMMRHTKRDEEAGGPGMGVLKTRKRTRRAGDGSIIVRPSQREMRGAAISTTSSASSDRRMEEYEEGEEEEEEGEEGEMQFGDEEPLSPPVSGTDHNSLSIEENDPFLAPMMPGGPFEPYVEPVAGQFDAADGSFNMGLDGLSDFFGMDTGMYFSILYYVL